MPLTLVACGGGDGESDEDKVIEVIETSATSDDPADCEALNTQAFLEQTQLSEGVQAIRDCEEEAEGEENDPKSVAVSNVGVEESTATADVAFTGGTYGGQTLSVQLIEEDGDWKLDEVLGFAEFDQDQLVATFEESLSSDEAGLTPQEVTCFGEALGALSKEETEEVLFGGSLERIVLFFEGCS
ncbi:MAG TPA: hypothetical protein VFM51_01800 [Solirubrobacterales bacterium]|nr:hypothetical protein [Solirubrobacterales bacterium]